MLGGDQCFCLSYSVMLIILVLPALLAASETVPRWATISGQTFKLSATSQPIVFSGPNVVVKATPYLPSVDGHTHCHDMVNSSCSANGDCTSCFTFNEADAALIKSQGRNFIRLGVVWAGAQPRDEDFLDPAFTHRLHALLNLTDKAGIHVMLDNHGDMTSSAGCGNGVPMWFSQKAAPELIGKQLETGFPFSLISSIRVDKVGGYDACGDNTTAWAEHAGDDNYNLLNRCCLAMNGGNPAGLGWTTINQKTMDFLITEGAGRNDFVRFWKLIAQEVRQHPSAFALEPMNEPMSINRRSMYDTWRAVTESVTQVVPDISVALADTGEGAILPGWVTGLLDIVPLPYLAPSSDTVNWIKKSTNVFYAWHYYGNPKTVAEAIENVQAISAKWNVPSFATEFMGCSKWLACAAANISHSYWHYSSYCNTGADFGNRHVPTDTFGGCMLGWGDGDEQFICP